MNPVKGNIALYTDLLTLSCKEFFIRYAGYYIAVCSTILLFIKTSFFNHNNIKFPGDTPVNPPSGLAT